MSTNSFDLQDDFTKQSQTNSKVSFNFVTLNV